MPDIISSAANPRIKQILKLDKAPGRKKSGLFKVEGLREIRQCLNGNYKTQGLFYCKTLLNDEGNQLLSSFSGETTEVSPSIFERVAYRGNRDGLLLLAYTPAQNQTAEHVKVFPYSLILVIESVEKPGNLGAILRTADAAGVDLIIVCNPGTDLYNPNVIRNSLGCVFKGNVLVMSSADAIALLKKHLVKMYAAELNASKRYDLVDYTGSSALIFGTEASGLSNLMIEAADERIIIPMAGRADSLNISASVAIVTFEALRQRNFKTGNFSD